MRVWLRRAAAKRWGIQFFSLFLPIVLTLGGEPLPPPQVTSSATACAPMPPFVSPHDRFGVNVIRDYGKEASDYKIGQTRAAWYLDYTTIGATSERVAYVRVLRISDLLPSDWQRGVERAVLSNPGALWFVGNETDRYSQDGLPADDYARIYHRTYHYIKQLDPTATVGNAAIIQATPIRLRYLDAFVGAYRALYGVKPPVDYWNIHNFILREELGSWGASIPPGFEDSDEEGQRFEVWQHGDFELFKSQIIAFRQWMAENDYRDVPLTVSEYGILMPADYIAEEVPEGQEPPPDVQRYDYPFVRQFMLASFDFFLNHTDLAIGYPQDGNRLVQSWSWFSLNDRVFSQETGKGSNGNLMDHETGALTPLGQDFAAYIEPLYRDYHDLALRQVKVTPNRIQDPENPGPVEIEVMLQNRGTLVSTNSKLKLYWDRGRLGRVLIGELTVRRVEPRCLQAYLGKVTWQPDSLPLGDQVIVAEIEPRAAEPESLVGNETAVALLRVGSRGSFPEIFLPVVIQ